MNRREQIEARARVMGLPMSVSVPVPIGELTEQGLTTYNEMRTVGVFSLSNVDAAMYSNLVAMGAPLLDQEGETLAYELVGQYGDSLKFLCHLGPGVLRHEMEHPDLLQQPGVSMQFSSAETAMLAWTPLFYALILLRQCILEYVSSLVSLDRDDAHTAHHLAAELLTFCGRDQLTYLSRVPLAGVDVAEAPVACADCILKKVSGEELGHISLERYEPWNTTRISRSLPAATAPWMWHLERVVLEIRQMHPKTKMYDPAVRCQKVLLALHLMSVEYCGAGFGAMLQEPLWIQHVGRSVYPLLMPTLPVGSITTVDAQLLAGTLDLAERIPDEAVRGPTSPEGLALRRVCLGMSKLDHGDAVVDYTVALEALLLRSPDVTEARRRFALHGAVYTARTAAARRKAYRDLTDIYSARSILVHGVDPKEKRAKTLGSRLQAVRARAAEISRIAVRRAMHSGWPTEQDFNDALLDEGPDLHLMDVASDPRAATLDSNQPSGPQIAR